MSDHAKNTIIIVLIIAIIALLGVIAWTNNAGESIPQESTGSTYETNTPAPQPVNGSTN